MCDPDMSRFCCLHKSKNEWKKNSNIRNNESKSDNRKAMILLVKLSPEIDILSDILKCFTTLDCNVDLTIQL